MRTQARIAILSFVVVCSLAWVSPAAADTINGTITGWPESVGWRVIGDGTNHVTLSWSMASTSTGWFYGGSSYLMDSEVARAPGVTDISQIVDASTLNFVNGYVGAYGAGTFLVWHNTTSGHYGVLRIDSIHGTGPWNLWLEGTWWFQTNGTGNFSAVPEPGTLLLLGAGLAGLALRRKFES